MKKKSIKNQLKFHPLSPNSKINANSFSRQFNNAIKIDHSRMSVEERFSSAVNVIRGLPKNGSYQPSIEMMLRFYAYFKQATEGPCTVKKPLKIWLEQRAKWDAWNKLENMPKEVAMESYVNELKKIVETMSLTDSVADFMGSINELGNVNFEDLELVAPEIIKEVKSRSNSPNKTNDKLPNGALPNGKVKENGYAHTNGDILTNGHHYENGNLTNGHAKGGAGLTNGFDSDDEFYDSVEDKIDNRLITNENFSRSRVQATLRNKAPLNSSSSTRYGYLDSDSINPHLQDTIEQMNRDLQQIMNRMNIVERSVSDMKRTTNHNQLQTKKYPAWWPFEDVSPQWFAFIILWPFIVNRVFRPRQN